MDKLPTRPAQLTQHMGFQKKTAVLILLKTLMRNLGIASDRHCIWAFIGLGWVHPGESDIENPRGLDISHQMEMWLEKESWPDANDFVGDTRQLWGLGLSMNPKREMMVSLAEELDERHGKSKHTSATYVDILSRTCYTKPEKKSKKATQKKPTTKKALPKKKAAQRRSHQRRQHKRGPQQRRPLPRSQHQRSPLPRSHHQRREYQPRAANSN